MHKPTTRLSAAASPTDHHSNGRSLRDAEVPDLLVGVVNDARDLVEAQVSSLKSDLNDLTTTIRQWLIALCLAIVTAVLLGCAIAATLTQVVGLPWYVSLWIVTAIAVSVVVGLIYRARATGRRSATRDAHQTHGEGNLALQARTTPGA